ncbi:MAG: hypothetical protein MUF04_00360, partial [Akkermansiaceae bacterium]|nr:hypothetical protein [Akkermansiaceae bacterium]
MKTPSITLLAVLSLLLPVSRADAGLLAHYSFDSGFSDGSGNSNHLSAAAGTPSITTTPGEFVFGGGALDLNKAENEYLVPTTAFSFSTTDSWSVSFWARRRPGAGIATGMVVGDNTTTDSFIWLPDNSTQVQGLRFRPVGVATTNNNDYATGHDNNFHHWVVVADGGGTIRVYRDNVDLGTRSPNGGTDFRINAVGSGYTGTNQIFDGHIDELYIFNEAIDAAKVGELFAGVSDTTPPTLAGGDISDDQAGGPVNVGAVVTYTVNFSEDMNAATVDAADFGNAGTAAFVIGAITEISPGVFTIEVTGTAAGTLRLRLVAGGTVTDAAGNGLDASAAITDDTTISVMEPPGELAVRRIRVFLLGGQSNADGRAAPSGLPTSPVNLQLPQDDVDFYENEAGGLTTLRPLAEFGPEITLGRRLADAIADGTFTRVAMIKYAVGATDLANDWKAGGDATTSGDGPRYVSFQGVVRAGLAALAAKYPNAAIDIEGMLWVQGERDAGDVTKSAN